MSRSTIETDCTRRCKSRQHGAALTGAITKRSVSDSALASFIRSTCANFIQAFDNEGRTALHMASSRGRRALTEWLARNSSEAFINARDRESGYTSLHKSLFYGQIHVAVGLIQFGVNTDLVDKDDYTALEHTMLDRQYMYRHTGLQPCDVYVWGSNSNYTLGYGTQQQKNVPDLLRFTRLNSSLQQVCLGKFHSIWLCDGEAYACGQASRAGAYATTLLRPTPLRLQEPCLQAAVTLDSTIFLLQTGVVIQYKQNEAEKSASQSTTKNYVGSIKLPACKPLIKLSSPLGVCAGRSHACVWNVNALYTWGVNLGQLGHPQDDQHVDSPKRVAIAMNTKEETGIQFAHASDAATIFNTTRGDVYLLHKFICKKIAIKQINLKQLCVDAKVNEHGAYTRVTVALLNNVGQILLWQDSTNQLTRCVYGLNHQTIVSEVTLTHDAMLFITKYGEAFIGTISRKNASNSSQHSMNSAAHSSPNSVDQNAFISQKSKEGKKSGLNKSENLECTTVKIKRIPNIHRAVSIVTDTEGLNFACLQIKPSCGLTCLPDLSPSSMCKHMDSLLTDANQDDLLHDVVFKVNQKLYPAHIFIVASGSDFLYKLYQEKKLQNPSETPICLLENVHMEVFDRILKYLYTGTCDVAELGSCSLKIRREDVTGDKKEKDSSPELDDDTIENSSEMSAFEVYKKDKTRKQDKQNKKQTTKQTRTHAFLDPVKLVQAAAKRLQVMGLHKLLDKFYYKEGAICLKESATYTKNPPTHWERETFQELSDVNVQSKEGDLIPAHKCILAARLEYFHGMFMHSWTESKTKSTVTLPVNQTILTPIINFLYTDTCPDVENSDSIDFICSLLIVSDQLFITRLREKCEIQLANLVNLKNCTEMCQFAHTYNATQLKDSCLEFISLNICNLLENRALEILSNDLLEDLTKYYCKVNKKMSSRIITPFFNAVTDDVINECVKNNAVDLNDVYEDLKKDDVFDVSKKKKASKRIEFTENEKERKRYESVSSVSSIDFSNEGDVTLALSKITKETEKNVQDKWIKIPTTQQKQQKLVQARLKAITTAKDLLNESPNEQFTKLMKNQSSANVPLSPNSPTTSRLSVSPNDSYIENWRSPQSQIVISHASKLSQKQRKKLAMQGHDIEPSQNIDFSTTKGENPLKISSPKNPWKVIETPAVTSPKQNHMEFNKILADQRKQKDDSSRIMSKPLNLTQLEDKAIEELERFYNIHEMDDEFISVRRIELQVSSPTWIHTAPK